MTFLNKRVISTDGSVKGTAIGDTTQNGVVISYYVKLDKARPDGTEGLIVPADRLLLLEE